MEVLETMERSSTSKQAIDDHMLGLYILSCISSAETSHCSAGRYGVCSQQSNPRNSSVHAGIPNPYGSIATSWSYSGHLWPRHVTSRVRSLAILELSAFCGLADLPTLVHLMPQVHDLIASHCISSLQPVGNPSVP